MAETRVILVNEQDDAIGEMEKMQAHREARLHRAFSVMLYRKQQDALEFLLQKRHVDKYHCGNLWTNTCCSHPHPGETVQEAAERRLQEELHLKVALKQIGHFRYIAEFANGLTEHEFDHVLIADYPHEVTDFNRDEISELKWVSADALQHELEKNPQTYTPWLSEVVRFCREMLNTQQTDA